MFLFKTNTHSQKLPKDIIMSPRPEFYRVTIYRSVLRKENGITVSGLDHVLDSDSHPSSDGSDSRGEGMSVFCAATLGHQKLSAVEQLDFVSL